MKRLRLATLGLLHLLGAMRSVRLRRRIVASAFEHPSVDAVLADLERRGFEIVRIRPDQDGVVPAQQVLDAARQGTTACVALMLAD